MSRVSVQGLRVRMGAVPVLEHLDLEVHPGEFLVLLGPSGCGKSTLLHSIAGLVDADAGRIDIGGRDVTWADPKDRGIGMVFQSYALYPTMDVERNMSFGLRVAGVPKAEVRRRVDRAADMLQLRELLRRKPAQLSGGQRQRVAIGRALVRDAQVFLFDEPLSNLDAKLRAELRRELKQLHQDLGATMVYVTHDQVEAMTLAHRVAVMRDGRIQQVDTPAEVYARPRNLFVAGFLGAPPMNLLPGTLQARGDGTWVAACEGLDVPLARYGFAAEPAAGRPVLLGVRPEHLRLAPGDGPASAQVTLVEPMGSHQVVWLSDGRRTVSALLPDGASPAVGERWTIGIEPDRVSLFDPDSGLRL